MNNQSSDVVGLEELVKNTEDEPEYSLEYLEDEYLQPNEKYSEHTQRYIIRKHLKNCSYLLGYIGVVVPEVIITCGGSAL